MKKYITFACALVAGVLVGRYVLAPKTRVETKEIIKYVETKEEKKNEKKKRKVVVTETTRPDGTKESSSTTEEEDVIVTDTTTRKDFQSDKSSKKITGSDLSISLIAIRDIPQPQKPISYGVVMSVPVVGNLNVTGMVTSDKQVGLGVGISF